MTEKECIEKEIPFFSFEAGDWRLDLHIETDNDGNRFPYGCISIKDYRDRWSEPTRVNIQDWTETFVHKMGYQDRLNKEEISVSMETSGEGKRQIDVVAMSGVFGSLKIDERGNVQCELNP